MANELFKALAKKMGKDKSMSILQKMANGGMPKDVTELAKYPGGGMINPNAKNMMMEMGKGKEVRSSGTIDAYKYGGGYSMKKKKKSKKKK